MYADASLPGSAGGGSAARSRGPKPSARTAMSRPSTTRPPCRSGSVRRRVGMARDLRMRRMRSLVSAAAVLAALITASPAAAITNGSPDGNRHPNVAGLVNDTQYPDGTWLYCSGTLISPTVVLTAAHCNDDGARTRVTFDPAYVEGDTTSSAPSPPAPLYPGPTRASPTTALMVPAQPVTGITPATLPTAGSLSD